MKLKGKSVLVTGGAGFIGSHLVDGLISKEPENIVVISSSALGKAHNLIGAQNKFQKLKIINQDASNYESMKKIIRDNSFDLVFNLAVIPLPSSLIKPKWVFQKNVIAIKNFFIVQRNRIKLFKSYLKYSLAEMIIPNLKHLETFINLPAAYRFYAGGKNTS